MSVAMDKVINIESVGFNLHVLKYQAESSLFDPPIRVGTARIEILLVIF